MIDTRWYDRAVASLEEDLDDGYISQDQFWQELRELNAELQYALQQAEQDFDN